MFGVAAACASTTEDSPPGGTGGGGVVCTDEICDGLDNDCDGVVDEDCPCSPGEEQECYTGPSNTANTGVCRPGTQECTTGGTWGECTGDITPGEELCDKLDNDCDGTVDNDCTPGTGGSGGVGGAYGAADYAAGAQDSFEYDAAPVPLPAEDEQIVTLRVEFSWQHVTSRPPPFDLAVRLAGVAGSVTQVFSVKGRPFVRIGDAVQAIEPGTPYAIEVSRAGTTVVARVVAVKDDTIVLSGPMREVLRRSGNTLTLVTPIQSPRVQLGELTTLRKPID